MKNNRRKFISKALTTGAAFAVGSVISHKLTKNSAFSNERTINKTKVNLKDLQSYSIHNEIEEFKNIDPKLLSHKEINTLPLHLEQPKDIEYTNDFIYILDNNQLIKTNNKGEILKAITVAKSSTCLTCTNQKIYLGHLQAVNVFNLDLKLLQEFSLKEEKRYISSIAVTEDFIHIGDAGNRVILQLSHNGEILKTIAQKNPDKGIEGLAVPSPSLSLSISPKGNLWTNNPGKHQLEEYDMEGNLLNSFRKTGIESEGFCGCCNPTHIKVIDNQHIITCEKGLSRVKIVNMQGELISVIAAPNTFDNQTKGLSICMSPDKKIYLLDPKRKQVRVFEKIERSHG